MKYMLSIGAENRLHAETYESLVGTSYFIVLTSYFLFPTS